MSALTLIVDSAHLDVQLAIGGFLAGYSGNTRLAYQQDLRCFVTWCWNHDLVVFAVRRTHIELFARSLELGGAARATTARRLSTVASFYRYCTEEEFIATNPAVNVRRPRLRHDSTIHGLDRNELGAFLVQAGLSGARDHALACLLALNGLRVSEALNCDVGDLGLERGHHTLKVHRKGGKTVIVPLAPRTARTVYLAIGERDEGTIFLNTNSDRMDRHQAARVVRRLAKRAGIDKRISPHSLRHSFITAALDAGVPSETSRKLHRMPTRAQRCATTGPAGHSTGTPPTSSPPSSQEPAASRPICAAMGDCVGSSSRPWSTDARDVDYDRRNGGRR